MEIAITLGALIASVAPIMGMYVVLRQRSDVDYEESLRSRNAELAGELGSCRRECSTLREENLTLMRRLLQFDNGEGVKT